MPGGGYPNPHNGGQGGASFGGNQFNGNNQTTGLGHGAEAFTQAFNPGYGSGRAGRGGLRQRGRGQDRGKGRFNGGHGTQQQVGSGRGRGQVGGRPQATNGDANAGQINTDTRPQPTNIAANNASHQFQRSAPNPASTEMVHAQPTGQNMMHKEVGQGSLEVKQTGTEDVPQQSHTKVPMEIEGDAPKGKEKDKG